MTRRRLFVLTTADREIDTQVAWYAEHAGATVARRFYVTLKTTFRHLVENPGHGRIFESPHAALGGVRTWLVRGFPFLVFYRAVDDGIEVIHVLHGARDRTRILAAEPDIQQSGD